MNRLFDIEKELRLWEIRKEQKLSLWKKYSLEINRALEKGRFKGKESLLRELSNNYRLNKNLFKEAAKKVKCLLRAIKKLYLSFYYPELPISNSLFSKVKVLFQSFIQRISSSSISSSIKGFVQRISSSSISSSIKGFVQRISSSSNSKFQFQSLSSNSKFQFQSLSSNSKFQFQSLSSNSKFKFQVPIPKLKF